MQIEPAMSQYERAATLPLVTESATVIAVEALDQNRVDTVVTAVHEHLAEAGVDPSAFVAGHDIDWAGVRAALPTRMGADIAVLRKRYERAHPSLVRIRLRPDEPVDFVPGQYVGVRYEQTPRAYSLACSPTAEALELCVSRVPDGRLSTRLCSALEVGATLTVRGPAGDFLLRDASERDLVFAATGTGVAPLRSMIEYTLETEGAGDRRQPRDIWLFLGARWRDDLPYHERWTTLADAHARFHYVPTLSREALLSDWTGETDYVQDVLGRYLQTDAPEGEAGPDGEASASRAEPVVDTPARIDPAAAEVYACGSNAMVSALDRAARACGVPAALIHTEGYG